MSSIYVRTEIKNFLTANAPTETFIDMTGRFEELDDLLTQEGVGPDDPWVGVQFFGDDEFPITIGANNTQGKYRETGAVYIHVVDLAKLGVSDNVLTRVENLRNLLRGRRIGSIFIESMTPANFDAGAALRFEDGWISGSFIAAYQRDLDL